MTIPLGSSAASGNNGNGNRVYDPGGKNLTSSCTFGGSTRDRDENLDGSSVKCDSERSADRTDEDSDILLTLPPGPSPSFPHSTTALALCLGHSNNNNSLPSYTRRQQQQQHRQSSSFKYNPVS